MFKRIIPLKSHIIVEHFDSINKCFIAHFFSFSFRVIQPICLGGFVSYFAQTDGKITRQHAYMYASGIVFAIAITVLTYHPFILRIYKTCCKVRVACSGLIYKKMLRLSKSSSEEGQNGQIINLLSNDLAKFDIGFAVIHETWKGPLETIAYFVVIYMEIGMSAVYGMAFLVCFVPLQGNLWHIFIERVMWMGQ